MRAVSSTSKHPPRGPDQSEMMKVFARPLDQGGTRVLSLTKSGGRRVG